MIDSLVFIIFFAHVLPTFLLLTQTIPLFRDHVLTLPSQMTCCQNALKVNDMRHEVLSDDGAGTPSIDGVVAGGIKPSGGETPFFGGTFFRSIQKF